MGGERMTIFIWYVHNVPMDWQMQMKIGVVITGSGQAMELA